MNGRMAIGIILIVIVGLVLTLQAVPASVDIKEPSEQVQRLVKEVQGVKIELEQIPTFLTPEEQQVLQKYDTTPAQPIDDGILVNVNQTSPATNQTVTDDSPLILTSVIKEVYKRGGLEPIPVVGKITKLKPPPYFYNVHATCCDMTTFYQASSVETDEQGNFEYRIRTTPQFPLGIWIITVSTIGDDNKMVKFEKLVRLVE